MVRTEREGKKERKEGRKEGKEGEIANWKGERGRGCGVDTSDLNHPSVLSFPWRLILRCPLTLDSLPQPRPSSHRRSFRPSSILPVRNGALRQRWMVIELD
ncbi:hypothetical protein E2C01_056184 [Portunus trituberculatus]|uniref:Uncharacterized protein n=1 Tax=Portunus trituberculatus TaxID=210409 RepID=A0A5B7GTD7_PORTR|nr:hypothetical protein [Portunus trituberculatus]